MGSVDQGGFCWWMFVVVPKAVIAKIIGCTSLYVMRLVCVLGITKLAVLRLYDLLGDGYGVSGVNHTHILHCRPDG